MTVRVGIGYDAHRLAEGARLVLGGVAVPSERGLAGHSDGDIAAHAVIDALLGAAALGDIGTHFPPDDPDTPPGVSSMLLLERAAGILRGAGWRVGNVDVTIVLERPRLREHVAAMREAMAGALGVDLALVSVKATTEDGLGFTGGGEGAAAMAVASIASITDENEAQ